MNTISARTDSAYNLAALFYLISFFGCCGETLFFLCLYGRFLDRGFLSLPLCTIYGSSVLLTYLLLGTPRQGRLKPLFLRAGTRSTGRFFLYPLLYLFYFSLVTVPPTAVELFVGLFFSKGLGNPLWDYGYHTLQLFGSICVTQSLIWGLLLTLGMSLLWNPLYALVGRIPFRIRKTLVWTLTVLVLFDFLFNFVFLLTRGYALHLYGIERNVF